MTKEIIEELKELRSTLKEDGYKSWCYSQLTIDKAIQEMDSYSKEVNQEQPTEIDWKLRCELAEKYIKETPCDPDIYPEQMKAYQDWNIYKDFGTKPDQ